MGEIDSSQIKQILKNQKIIFTAWNASNINDNPYQNWYLPLKDTFGKVISFDTARNYFRYGRQKMQQDLIDLISRENPDYLFTVLIYDELDPLFFQKVKKISPNTIIISLFSDDDWRYEDFSRYYGLFIHYPIINITDDDTAKGYRKDGIKYYSLSLGMNCKLFRKLDLSKKYEVTFVGRPNKSRVDYVKFLIDKGIDIKVWGDGWENYPEVNKAYQGLASADDLVRITNESKINLSFTKGGYGKLQMKGRVFEAGACGGFTLIERFDVYKKYYIEGKEMDMFDSEDELLSKIKYYLKHENERENMARRAHDRTLKSYNKHLELIKYFNDILSNQSKLFGKSLPKIDGNISFLKLNDLYRRDLPSILSASKYVAFKGGKSLPYQYIIQSYSLQKTGKKISCCDAYYSSMGLSNYLMFKAKQASIFLNKGSFKKSLQLPQLLIEKKYFLDNLESIRRGDLDINEFSFVSLPLVIVSHLPQLSEEDFNKAFQLKFLDRLYSLWFQKKILFHPYLYFLVIEALRNKTIRNILSKNLKDQKKLRKVKKGL